MEVSEAMSERRSIRKFFPKPIETELIGALMAAGSKAPSVGDLQPWRFIVVTKAKQLQAVADSCPYERWLYQVPLVVVICSLHTKADAFYPGKGKQWADHSCAAAAQNMLLAAVDLGLGGCWVSAFENEKLKESLHIPGGIEPEILLAFGYPDEEPQAKRTEPFDALVFWNNFGDKSVDRSLIKKDFGLYFSEKADDVKTRIAYETEERGGLRMRLEEAQEKLRSFFSRAHSPKNKDISQNDHSSNHQHDGHDHP